MTKHITKLTLLFSLAFLAGSCANKNDSRWLVVSEAIHFGVQPGSGTLSLPVFAGTLGVDNIVHDISQAEFYHQKLASVYGEKSFHFLADSTIEVLLDRSGPLTRPQSVYGYESGAARIELDLMSFESAVAHYSFRVTNKETGQIRTHQVEVPVGQSASVGLLFDPVHNRGYLVALSVQAMEITSGTTPENLANFLREKNTPRGVKSSSGFRVADQKWMNELFGTRALILSDSLSDDASAEVQPFDTPPMPVGGMNAIAALLAYPESALRDTIEGRVVVAVKVDSSGSVTSCQVIRSLRADLDSVVVRAMPAVAFTPAIFEGNPVATTVMIPIEFKLK
ncbi:MAG: energy transducer TonB [Calditrichaeota bacterium]|nr:energy transducer TonB [Calditrichota bacterium]MCB9367186.1 energy transducer TonB [Calditrichota bacterium]